ncbi:MAG: hypothetical protein J7L47_06485 [Candidatus Odinarchaeota archaeon]|nr:hypothetical protein [Candidatus Odinarchaeota archaeon]
MYLSSNMHIIAGIISTASIVTVNMTVRILKHKKVALLVALLVILGLLIAFSVGYIKYKHITRQSFEINGQKINDFVY